MKTGGVLFAILLFSGAVVAGQTADSPAPSKPAATSAPILLRKVAPEYTEAAKAAHIEGTVVVQVVITDKGMAEDIRVLRALDDGLDRKAVEAVAKWQFRPAMKNGAPVAAKATIEVNFRLPD